MSVTGDNIRALRMMRGLTQAQLASAVGVSVGVVNRWERGEIPELRVAHRQALMRRFHLSEDDLSSRASGLAAQLRAIVGGGHEAGESKDARCATPESRDLRPIALNIRALRLARGLTQEELAKEAGVTRRTVAAWEAGEIEELRISHKRALMAAFGITRDELDSRAHGLAAKLERAAAPAGDGEGEGEGENEA